MSVVTDIILVTIIDDGAERDGEHPNVDRLNAWIHETQGPPEALRKVDDDAGGNKAMQCDVFMAAINYLDKPGLIRAFRGIPWEAAEAVQLMLKGEDDDLFTMFQIDDGGNVLMLEPQAAAFWHDNDA